MNNDNVKMLGNSMIWRRYIMNLIAYARLLNRKINSVNSKAKNPFTENELMYNPFRTMYNTLVWIEADENYPTRFDKKDY